MIRSESVEEFFELDRYDVLGKGRNDAVVVCVRRSDGKEFAAKSVDRDELAEREVV